MAFFIATIYINTAYAQEFDNDTHIPGWSGLEELVQDAYKHHEDTSPTYTQPTSGRVGFIDRLDTGKKRAGILVQADYCWYLSGGCMHPTTLTLTKKTQVTTIRLVGNGSTLVTTVTRKIIRDVSVTTTVAYTTKKTFVQYDEALQPTITVHTTTLRGTTTTAQDVFVTEDAETIPSTLQGDTTVVTTAAVTLRGELRESCKYDNGEGGCLVHIFHCPGTPSEIFKCPVLPERKTKQIGSLAPSVVKLRLNAFLGSAIVP